MITRKIRKDDVKGIHVDIDLFSINLELDRQKFLSLVHFGLVCPHLSTN